MPLCIQRCDEVLHDSSVTSSAPRCKHVKVILLTVRSAVLLMEAILTKRLTALGAEEVLWMPGLIQSCHTPILNRSMAVGTFRSEEVMIVLLTKRLSVSLKERLRTKLLLTLSAHKVLRMPRLS